MDTSSITIISWFRSTNLRRLPESPISVIWKSLLCYSRTCRVFMGVTLSALPETGLLVSLVPWSMMWQVFGSLVIWNICDEAVSNPFLYFLYQVTVKALYNVLNGCYKFKSNCNGASLSHQVDKVNKWYWLPYWGLIWQSEPWCPYKVTQAIRKNQCTTAILLVHYYLWTG